MTGRSRPRGRGMGHSPLGIHCWGTPSPYDGGRWRRPWAGRHLQRSGAGGRRRAAQPPAPQRAPSALLQPKQGGACRSCRLLADHRSVGSRLVARPTTAQCACPPRARAATRAAAARRRVHAPRPWLPALPIAVAHCITDCHCCQQLASAASGLLISLAPQKVVTSAEAAERRRNLSTSSSVGVSPPAAVTRAGCEECGRWFDPFSLRITCASF
jgi:hypothetical protein